jgi:hypothetical protein
MHVKTITPVTRRMISLPVRGEASADAAQAVHTKGTFDAYHSRQRTATFTEVSSRTNGAVRHEARAAGIFGMERGNL